MAEVNVKQDLVELFRKINFDLVEFTRVLFNIKEPSAKFHGLIGDLLLNKRENIAIEGFRECGKTSMVVYGYPIYRLVFPRKDLSYIVLLKSSDELAKIKVKEIRDLYFSNGLFSSNVSKVYGKGEFLDVGLKDGVRVRIEGYGKGTNVRGLNWLGRRPDIVILDDVQTMDDVNSVVISDRDWEWFLSDIFMLGKSSRIFMIGNNLGARCIIERLGVKSGDFGFKFYRIPAIKDGRSLWPSKFSKKFLENEKKAYESAGKLDVWLRERMCVSMSEDNQIFKRSYFNYYDELPSGRYNYFTGVDLAVSKSSKADYSVVLTLAVNQDNQRFIVDIDYGRFLVDEIMEKIFKHVVRYNPLCVAVESVAFQAVMERLLQKEMLRRNCFFQLKMIKPKGKKEDRIKGLQPLYSAGAVWHKANVSWLSELEDELLLFDERGTKAEHDDVLDALWLANNISMSPKKNNMKIKKVAKFI